jgi:hypothetical protein
LFTVRSTTRTTDFPNIDHRQKNSPAALQGYLKLKNFELFDIVIDKPPVNNILGGLVDFFGPWHVRGWYGLYVSKITFLEYIKNYTEH